MTNATIIHLLSYGEPFACLVSLFFLRRSQQSGNFRFLQLFLIVRVVSIALAWPLAHNWLLQISPRISYIAYFYIYWLSFAIEALIGLGMVYDVYKLAMDPLKGLKILGMIMFRFAAFIAVAVAVGLGVGPHSSAPRMIIKTVSQLQQTDGILTLCLLLFVTLAIRPMGLSFRSRIFGVSFGLGILSAVHLVGAAWISQGSYLVSSYNLIDGVTTIAAFSIWAVYFALPEPKRRMIVLPTTSPFLRWNQISLALGDSPGFVAIAGIDPSMIAPAELEVMLRASRKMDSIAS